MLFNHERLSDIESNWMKMALQSSKKQRRAWLTILALLGLLCRTLQAQSFVVSNYQTFNNALADTSLTVINNFLTNSTISLTTSGQHFNINRTVLIDGGTNGVVFDGNGVTRLFTIGPTGHVTLNSFQIINGSSTNGGAIYNQGTLIISNCIIGGNSATNRTGTQGITNSNGNGSSGTAGGSAQGGAIYSTGPLSIYYSVVGTNSALGGSGGSGGGGGNGVIFGGNGGNAGGGGSAFGGAVFAAGSNNVFVSSQFLNNICTAGTAGSGGVPGSGPFPGYGGAGAPGGSAGGGAVYLTGSGSVFVTNCLFAQNTITAGDSGTDGTSGDNGFSGGVAEGGGVFINGTVTNAYFENGIFYQNACTGGAGGSATSGNDGGNGGTAAGGGLASSARLAILRNCTLASNTLAAGAGGTGTAKDGSSGSTGGWDIYRVGGLLDLSGSILSGGTNETPNLKPNAFGVTDEGYNQSSDASLTRVPGGTTLIDVDSTNLNLNSGLDAEGGPVIGPGGLLNPPAFLTLAIESPSAAAGFIPGVPGLSFPATDEQGNPRGTPASAGAYELNFITIDSNAAPPTVNLDTASTIYTNEGSWVTMTVSAVNNDATNNLGYQWQHNGTNLVDNDLVSGSTTSNLTTRLESATEFQYYQVIVGVSTLENVATSSIVTVVPISPAQIKVQPVSRSGVRDGSVVTFSVSTVGSPPPTYQWFQITSDSVTNMLTDTGEFSGSTTATLTINPATSNDQASYFVEVTNMYGGATSVKASLSIGGPDVSKPTVAFSSPLAGARESNLVVTGAAADTAQVTNVFYWITNINAGRNPVMTVSSNTAILGANGATTKTWSISNVFLPGTNYVTVQSINYGGHESTLATREFFYESPAELRLEIEGDGTVTGSAPFAADVKPANGAMLNIGEGYTLTAVPVKNNVLSNWFGSFPGVVSDSPKLHFIMEAGMKIQAKFSTNHFIGAAGNYNGLFYGAPVTKQTAGMLRNLTIEPNGTYSGTLMLGGLPYTLSSSFSTSGYASNYVKRTAAQGGPLAVEMILDWAANLISGSVISLSPPGWDSPLEAEKSAASSSSAAYTVLLDPGTNATGEIPPGSGYMLITNHNGSVILSGALADGTTFSEAPPLGVLGDIPVYANLYSNDGLLLGWLGLTNGTVQAETPMAWIKPAARIGIYTNGFTNFLLVVGSGWTNPPPKESAITVLDGSLAITNASLDLDFIFSITNNAIFKSSNTPENSLTGSVAPKTGLLTVTFGNGIARDTTIGYGAILQNSTNGRGYFITRTNAGAIRLTP
jgi:hypothetical protein